MSIKSHADQVAESIKSLKQDQEFKELSNAWIRKAINHGYFGNFTWLGRPIIQVPQDIYAIQELIWSIKPDLIIETGVAHGGSIILSASMLALLDYSDAVKNKTFLDPTSSLRRVIGIDIEIREQNRHEIDNHPLKGLIHLVEGSSIDPEIVKEVAAYASQHKTIMVFLDSNHTHQHVLEELKLYAPMVTMGSYCVVWDTGVEDLPEGFVKDRPWGKGNNPKTAVLEYLSDINKVNGSDLKEGIFAIDENIESKLMITASPGGFLCRIR